MSLGNTIEKLIAEAIERGDFDNLRGKGKPIDLGAYFSTPEDLRMAYSILKSNEFVPKEVELMREIADAKSRLELAENEDERRRYRLELNERELALRLEIERRQGRRSKR